MICNSFSSRRMKPDIRPDTGYQKGRISGTTLNIKVKWGQTLPECVAASGSRSLATWRQQIHDPIPGLTTLSSAHSTYRAWGGNIWSSLPVGLRPGVYISPCKHTSSPMKSGFFPFSLPLHFPLPLYSFSSLFSIITFFFALDCLCLKWKIYIPGWAWWPTSVSARIPACSARGRTRLPGPGL